MSGTAAAQVAKSLARSGPLEGATHIGTVGEPGEGAYVRIWLILRDGVILAASSMTHGCPSSQLACAMLTTLIAGRTPEQALQLEGKDIEAVLGGLPPGKGMFADMAISAMRKALEETR